MKILRVLTALLLAAGVLVLLALFVAFVALAQLEMQVKKDAAALAAHTGTTLDALDGIGEARGLIAQLSEQVANVGAQLSGARADANQHLQVIEADAHEQIGAALAIANGQLSTLNETIEANSETITGQIAAQSSDLSEHLKLTLDNATQLEADADTTVKDLRPQLLGLTAAAKITAGETAQTLKTVRDNAKPIADDFHRAADDVTREADYLTAPKHWWQKIFPALMDALHLAAGLFGL